MMLPPVIFGRGTLRFLPLGFCSGVEETVDGLKDDKGRRVVPILHRPTLAEKRTWSFSDSLMTEVSKPRKLMVISDDFGEGEKQFSKLLAKTLAQKNMNVDFVKWEPHHFGSTMRGSIGKLVKRISESNADRVLIIPSVRDAHAGIPLRTQIRSMAAIVQLAMMNKNTRMIHLATPFPSLNTTRRIDDMAGAIGKLCREYGIEKLDINKFVRNRPGWRLSYRYEKDNDDLYENHPVHMVDEICLQVFNLF